MDNSLLLGDDSSRLVSDHLISCRLGMRQRIACPGRGTMFVPHVCFKPRRKKKEVDEFIRIVDKCPPDRFRRRDNGFLVCVELNPGPPKTKPVQIKKKISQPPKTVASQQQVRAASLRDDIAVLEAQLKLIQADYAHESRKDQRPLEPVMRDTDDQVVKNKNAKVQIERRDQQLKLASLDRDLRLLKSEQAFLDSLIAKDRVSTELKQEVDIAKKQLDLMKLKYEAAKLVQADSDLEQDFDQQQQDKDLAKLKSEIDYFEAELKLAKLKEKKEPTSEDLMNEQMASDDVAEKFRKHMAGKSRSCDVFEFKDTPFVKNLPALIEGYPASTLSSVLPSQWRAHSYEYTFGPSGCSGAHIMPESMMTGWSDTILISDFSPSKANYHFLGYDGTITAVAGVTGGLIASQVRKTSWWSAATVMASSVLMGSVASSLAHFSTLIKTCELRAAVISVEDLDDDNRPYADRVDTCYMTDRLAILQPFVVYRLVTGQIVISFDASVAGLSTWSESLYKVLGVVTTDVNKHFRKLAVSENMIVEAINRRSLVVSAFEKARAVERMHKLLENQNRLSDSLSLLLYTGHSLYKDSLSLVAALVTRDPHTPPSDF